MDYTDDGFTTDSVTLTVRNLAIMDNAVKTKAPFVFMWAILYTKVDRSDNCCTPSLGVRGIRFE